MGILEASNGRDTAPAITDTFYDILILTGTADVMPHHHTVPQV